MPVDYEVFMKTKKIGVELLCIRSPSLAYFDVSFLAIPSDR